MGYNKSDGGQARRVLKKSEVDGTSGHSSMVELQPSKLAVRVRFPLPAPFCTPNLPKPPETYRMLYLMSALPARQGDAYLQPEGC